MSGSSRLLLLALVTSSLAGCGQDASEVPGYSGLERRVAGNRIGSDADHWIEMQNMMGEWERVGLIFGYDGDYDECINAINGLKAVNYAREYRCVPAN